MASKHVTLPPDGTGSVPALLASGLRKTNGSQGQVEEGEEDERTKEDGAREDEDDRRMELDVADLERIMSRLEKIPPGQVAPPPVPETEVNDLLVKSFEELRLEAGRCLADLEAKVDDNMLTKATVAYLKGRIMAIDKDSAAEEQLSKAVKLDPSNAKAWNCLGELYWKADQKQQAKDCFTTCLEQQPNSRVVLRNLSMLLRKMGSNAAEKVRNHEESLKHAKAAVALNFSDPESWYVLGNTHLALFFSISHNHKDLESALKAYRRSEGLSDGLPGNSDLFFNRAQVLAYMEEYEMAIQDYRKAHQLDPTLPAQEQMISIMDRVKETKTSVDLRGGWTSAELKEKLRILKEKPGNIESFQKKDSYDTLSMGLNSGVSLDTVFIKSTHKERDPFTTFIAADCNAKIFVVTVFNLSQAVDASANCVVTVTDPIVRTVSLGEISYPSIQVFKPSQLYINSKACTNDMFAHASINSNNL